MSLDMIELVMSLPTKLWAAIFDGRWHVDEVSVRSYSILPTGEIDGAYVEGTRVCDWVSEDELYTTEELANENVARRNTLEDEDASV